MKGYPTWSPDLGHMILLNTDIARAHMAQAYGELVLADGTGEELDVVGTGSTPFWLDDEAYGFVIDAGEGRRNTVLSGKIETGGKTTAVVISGGNVDIGMYASVQESADGA